MAIRGLAFFACFLATPAWGQPCAEHDKALDNLAKRYDERPTAIGITSGGLFLEVLTTKDGTTWTIILTSPQGISCILESGDNWRTKLWAPEGEGT